MARKGESGGMPLAALRSVAGTAEVRGPCPLEPDGESGRGGPPTSFLVHSSVRRTATPPGSRPTPLVVSGDRGLETRPLRG